MKTKQKPTKGKSAKREVMGPQKEIGISLEMVMERPETKPEPEPLEKMSPDEKEKLGWLLLKAIVDGNRDEVGRLLEAGADANGPQNPELTPLMMASAWGQGRVVLDLLNAGADIDIASESGLTAKEMAAEANHLDIIHLLIGAGAEPTPEEKLNIELLAKARKQYRWEEEEQKGLVEEIKGLLDAGANIEARNSFKFTPLMNAVREHNVGVCQFLMDRGADINAIERRRYTVLDLAMHEGASEFVLLLARAGAKRASELDEKEAP